jgi:Na+-translocating ferredoxin:NAD+ oxidoreductase RnfA subunit
MFAAIRERLEAADIPAPFRGTAIALMTAGIMSLATAFVLTLSSATAYLLHEYVLVPLDLEYLRTLGFILVIAASVQFTEIMVRRMSPLLDQVLGIYIPLIATNCAVLGVARLSSSCLPLFENGWKPLTFLHPFGEPLSPS